MPVRPPVLGEDVRQWGRQLNLFLTTNLGKLFFKTSTDNPSENGIFLWDDDKNYPVVSAQNSFKQIAMKQTTPTSSVGAAGDGAGMIAWDSNYIYICTAAHNGSTAIWKRVALTSY
ncbi:putative Copper binding proteins [uncultured Mediterranean phage uvMED]|nr:putative Copper binding proteins [uncultured Mediterranean phage uvMED]BAR19722.1 putative Copper binding proteins [uncultured Mediterranean phage uvMED]BAR19783.1 putative Copper binding proteins [uncultured Mediterranean phage uvMED]